MKIEALILDLDDTLYPAKSIERSVYAPLLDMIPKHLPLASAEEISAIKEDIFLLSLSQFMRKYAGLGSMARSIVASLGHISPGPIRPYPDIGALGEMKKSRFLVTAGNVEFQMKKVRALGIEGLFAGIYIDDVLNATGKRPIFEDIIRRHYLSPGEVLVAGDNPESEIKAGNELGCVTVQVLRPGIIKGENAVYYISDLHQLAAITI